MILLKRPIGIATSLTRQLHSSSPLLFNRLDLSSFAEKFKEVYQDDQVLIVNKAPGVACQDLDKGKRTHREVERRGVFSLLKSLDPEMREVVRLDKCASGGILVAKDRSTSQRFSRFLQNNGNPEDDVYRLKRRYVAIIGSGEFPEASENLKYLDSSRRAGEIETSTGKGKGITKFIRYPGDDEYQLVILQPETERKHQVRQHLGEVIKRPIFNDKRYGYPGPLTKKRDIGLHAAFIETLINQKSNKVHVPVSFNVENMWDNFVDNEGNFHSEVKDILFNFDEMFNSKLQQT